MEATHLEPFWDSIPDFQAPVAEVAAHLQQQQLQLGDADVQMPGPRAELRHELPRAPASVQN